MAISSEEVNFLVLRYLQESGFHHAAFTFGFESGVQKSNIHAHDVPPGALISFIQKGMQYLELEANLNDAGTEVEGDFGLLSARDLLTRSIEELKEMVKERRENIQNGEMDATGKLVPVAEPLAGGRAVLAKHATHLARTKDAMDIDGGAMLDELKTSSALSVPPSHVLTLRGHTSEVFHVLWSPVDRDLVASVAGDASAKLWRVSGGGGESAGSIASCQPLVLNMPHGSKDVTCGAWSSDGQLFATGGDDGATRLFSPAGALLHTFPPRRGAVFAVRFSPTSQLLAHAGVDAEVHVYDTASRNLVQKWTLHNKAVLDVDWCSDSCFASCSTDQRIHICDVRLDDPTPSTARLVLQGHQDEINCIRFDTSGSFLASCSDDGTAKVWDAVRGTLLHSLQHDKSVYALRWQPTSGGTGLLATASFDHTVRLWDATRGQLLHNFQRHSQPVYSIAFSPCGSFLASGSFDGEAVVWSIKEGKAIRSHRGGGGIFHVEWNRDKSRLGICYSDHTIHVLDMHQML